MGANARTLGAKSVESSVEDISPSPSTTVARGVPFSSINSELLLSWSHAVAAGELAEPFFQPYWFSSYARTFASNRPVDLFCANQGQKVIGALPLIRQGTFFGCLPARTLHSLSNVHSCRFDLSCASMDREAAAHAIWDALRADPTWDVIEVQHVPAGGAFESVMKLAAYDGFLIGKWPTLLSPYMSIPQGVADIFATCPERFAGFRRTHLKSLKKLEKQGRVTCSSVSRFEPRVFEAFVAMEGAGWKGRVGGAISCSPIVESFYREMLRAASEAGHLLCHSLSLDDRPIAMDIGLMMKGRYYSLKIAYDESFAKFAPGQLLIRHTIQLVAELGGDYYDFVGPRSHHKAFWTDTVREHATYYIFRSSWPGFARYLAAMKVGPQLRRLKRWRYGDPQTIT